MLRETNHPVFGDDLLLKRERTSDRIRGRLAGAGARHHANDNISAFIEEGELQELTAEVQDRMQEVLRALVIDTANDHNSRATAQRVARMFVTEVFRGRYAPPPSVTEFPNASRWNELMVVGPLALRSACSHHLCPIIGKV
jgi:GTP cyclohydrolase I